MILAAALTLAIDVRLDLTSLVRHGAKPQLSTVTCGIKTVGYRFVGKPGDKFRYSGDTYVIPEEGEMELIADRRATTYLVSGRSLPLDVWPTDQYGFRTVPMPTEHAENTINDPSIEGSR